MIRLSAIATIIVTLNLQPLGAHEFWLMPQNFTPEPGENLQIDIKVGQDFNGAPMSPGGLAIIRP